MKKYFFLFLFFYTGNLLSMSNSSETGFFSNIYNSNSYEESFIYSLEYSKYLKDKVSNLHEYTNNQDQNLLEKDLNINDGLNTFFDLEISFNNQKSQKRQNNICNLENQPPQKKNHKVIIKKKKKKKRNRKPKLPILEKQKNNRKLYKQNLIKAKRIYKKNIEKYENESFTEEEIINDIIEKVYKNKKVRKDFLAKNIFKNDKQKLESWKKQHKKSYEIKRKKQNIESAKKYREREKNKIQKTKNKLMEIEELVKIYKKNNPEPTNENIEGWNLAESIFKIINEINN